MANKTQVRDDEFVGCGLMGGIDGEQVTSFKMIGLF